MSELATATTGARRRAAQAALLLATLTALCACSGDDAGVEGAGGVLDGSALDATADGAASADVGADGAAAEDTGAESDAAATGDNAGGADSAADSEEPPDAAADAAPGVCPDPAACDDKRSCTADDCAMPGAVCSWLLLPGNCLIAGACYAKDAANPANPCQVCHPSLSTTAWSAKADGAACEDGVTCTIKGTCKAGACAGVPLECDDGNPCTADICSEGVGCSYPALLGSEACDDGDGCTKADACTEGICLGVPLACDDSNPCTSDACDGKGGCSHAANANPCSDSNACTLDDACVGAACKGGAATPCDDGNACTIDSCDVLAGCVHLPTQNPCCTGATSICDDGDPCTTDLCLPSTGGCTKAFNTAVCNDGDACTAKDTCAGGKCQGAAAGTTGNPKGCDDGNPCTLDACDKKSGCVASPTAEGKACDDGNPCTKSDACKSGACKGTGACACTPTFSPTVAKVTSLQIGKGGQIGQGLDLDGNPKTCAPKSSCTGGIDNALGAIAGLVNGQLVKPVTDGSILLLVEVMDFKQGPVTLAIHQGKLDPANASCDIQKAGCLYTADASLLDALTCKPKASLAGKVVGDTLTAGGKGTVFPLSLPLQDGVYLNLTLYDLQLTGTISVSDKKVVSFSGILGGAVPKVQLMAAIDALPNEGLPLPKDAIKTLLDSTVETDIDADGDGKKESSSIALLVQGVAGKLSGVTLK